MDEPRTIPRMRTAKQAAIELRAMDPNTVIREYHIRALINSGALPTVCAGTRKFINLDVLIDYLNTPGLTELSPKAPGKIRPVPERGR